MKFAALLFAVVVVATFYLMFAKTDFRFKFKEPKIIPPPMYSAWIPYWDQERALGSLEKSANKLSYLSPMWYVLDKDGLFTNINKGDQEKINVIAKAHNIKLVPAISNEFDPQRIGQLLNSKSASQAFIGKAVEAALDGGFKGFDVDFEEIDLSDKDKYSLFIKDFAEKLHKNNLQLSVSVHVQTGKNTDRPQARAQDWEEISKYADFIRIMVYDFHNTKTDPGAITPTSNFKQVLKYAISVVPTEKIVVGLPLYGYVWGTKNTSIEYLEAKSRIDRLGGSLLRDGESLELTGNLSQMGVVWIEDSESVVYKVNLSRFYGIYQFIFWRLGGEDLTLWDKL